MLRKIKSVFSFQFSVFRKEIFLCLLSAVLLILSFPRFNIEFFAWVGFVPLFFAIQNKSKCKVFFLSYLTGIIFWLGIIYWLIHVTFIGLIFLVLYLALYFGTFGLIISTIDHRLSTIDALFIPSLWVILEYIRSHLFTGFGWALLGYSQYLNLVSIQIADITGVYGVSFLIMTVNVAIKEVLGFRSEVLGRKKQAVFMIMFCSVFLIGALLYGYYRLNQTPNTQHQTPIKVSIIQGNIPQELKWQSYSQEFILDRYIKLSKEASLHKPDLIIWPEASSPGFLFKQADAWIFQNMFNLAKELKANLLIGTIVIDKSDYFNSVVLIDSYGAIIKRYDKIHLVPFGEYIPLKRTLPFLKTIVPIGDFAGGREYTVFKVTSRKPQAASQDSFSVLICFEDLFPELSRRFVKNGAGFMVNITNDAWFGRTSSPFQHLALSVMRAVENRRFLVRAANTGVSCFITPEGTIKSLVSDNKGRAIFITGHKTADISTQRSITFYTRHGDVFILACLILVIYGIISKDKKRG